MFVDLQEKREYCNYNPTNSGQDKRQDLGSVIYVVGIVYFFN